jgi:hypothetical protein
MISMPEGIKLLICRETAIKRFPTLYNIYSHPYTGNQLQSSTFLYITHLHRLMLKPFFLIAKHDILLS